MKDIILKFSSQPLARESFAEPNSRSCYDFSIFYTTSLLSKWNVVARIVGTVQYTNERSTLLLHLNLCKVQNSKQNNPNGMLWWCLDMQNCKTREKKPRNHQLRVATFISHKTRLIHCIYDSTTYFWYHSVMLNVLCRHFSATCNNRHTIHYDIRYFRDMRSDTRLHIWSTIRKT